MDIAEFAFAVENFLRPFARHAELPRKGAKEFDNLCDVIVVFTVFRARLWVEEVVTCD